MLKFVIERALLLKSLAHVQSVVERRQTIPILSNVLLQASDENGGSLILRATDNELEICDKVQASVEQGGTITVSAHKLYDIAKKLPDGAQVECSYVEDTAQLMVVSGRSRFALPTISAEGYPTMPVEAAAVSFSVTTEELKSLIERTQFAMSTEETRYNLNGIYWHVTKGDKKRLKAAATDGHRLATAEIALPEGADEMVGVIIPRKTISELMKLLSETDQDVTVSVSENQIRFSFGDVVLASRLIDGTYPEYEKVIPENNNKFLEVDSNALTTVVDRVAVISEKSRGIKLSLKQGCVVLTASNADEGTAEDELEAGYDAESIEIGFNYRYLLDILAQIKGGTVRFSLSENTSPVLMQDAGDDTALYVLMPMRV